MTTASPKRLERPDGESIAYHKTEGKTPGVIFCGGFMSDMTGSKAMALEAHCYDRDRLKSGIIGVSSIFSELRND